MAVIKVVAGDTVEDAFLNKYNPTTDEIITAVSRVGNIITYTKEGGGTFEAILLEEKNKQLSGLSILKGANNLTFDISAGTYIIDNAEYAYIGGSVALNAGDPTNDRLDIIVADEANNVLAISGVAAASPIAPIASATQLLLATVLVKANATTISTGGVFINLVLANTSTGLFFESDELGQVVESGAGVTTLAALTDVDLTGLTDGDRLIYNSGTAKWERQQNRLDNLLDTDIDTPQDDEFLVYDNGTNKWFNTDSLNVANFAGVTRLTGVITPVPISSNIDDYNPPSLNNANVLRISSTINIELTGLVAQSEGYFLWVFNVGTNDIKLKENNSSSSANNRFLINGDINIKEDESVLLWYDISSLRWRTLNHN
jgi:hypothetical protein